MVPKLFPFTAACLLATSMAMGQGVYQAPVADPGAAAPLVAPAATAPRAAASPQLELLRQKIAQRDQLHREIDELVIATQTPQQMVVHIELLEVNITAAGRPEGNGLTVGAWTVEEIEELRKKGLAKSLAAPRLAAASGQFVNSQVGGANGSQQRSSSTDVQLRPDSLGSNVVRIALRVEHTENGEDAVANREGAQHPPQFAVDTNLQMQFGETQILSGLVTKRTQTRRGALGRVTEMVTLERIVVVRAEPILPRTAGVVPAAFTPR